MGGADLGHGELDGGTNSGIGDQVQTLLFPADLRVGQDRATAWEHQLACDGTTCQVTPLGTRGAPCAPPAQLAPGTEGLAFSPYIWEWAMERSCSAGAWSLR